ncbi:MAG: GNAT family N-acetyltransferase [Chloroflexi bacterium]|nr:GNAT family N-acetyltransferase [Chloroflexota bacterium]
MLPPRAPWFSPPDPPLADEVVALRPPSTADVPAIAAACTDPEIARWTAVPSPYTPAHARRFVAQARRWWRTGRTAAVFAIVERASDQLVGMIGLEPVEPGLAEVGYWIAPGARRRGFATRAVRLVSTWAFSDRNLVRLELHALAGNEASCAVARKAGFGREGVARSGLVVRGQRTDGVVFALIRGDPGTG